jgi:Kdo2-lipid IVA lauroyltransferase/acyltransferase
MQRIVFYLFYPLIYLIASLPFWALYKLSDFFYYLLILSGYRKKIIIKNLSNSFPKKSASEIHTLYKKYNSYLCDLVFETLKTLTMTEKEAKERCIFHHPSWLKTLHDQNKSIIVVMGHYGNWEWAGPSFSLYTNYQLVVVYYPLTNPYFEKMMKGMRTKFGTKITPAVNTLREMVANRKHVTATALIADQTAFADQAYWMTFLNQDTAVFTGPEKLSKKFDYPVVYMNVKRIKRGFYEITPELLFEFPNQAAENEITERFTRRLEEEIQIMPETWLWSHRRWKYSKTV